MTRTFEVITPEQVAIRYELAGYGSRAFAAMIDYFVLLVAQAIVLLVFLLAAPPLREASLAHTIKASFVRNMESSVVIAIFILINFLLTWGYYIAFETLKNGVTPGKKLLGLRVMKDGGFPVDFRAALIRNLLRPVDMLPGVPTLPIYGAAFIAVLCSPQYKRLGDMAAGTLVVKHGRGEEEEETFSFGDTVTFRLLDPTIISQLGRVTREEFMLVQRYLQRRNTLPYPLRAEFARRLATPLMEKLAYEIPMLGIDYDRWLDEIDFAYRSRAIGTVASPPITPTPAPTPATPPPPPSDGRRW